MRYTAPRSMSFTDVDVRIRLSGFKSQYSRPCWCRWSSAGSTSSTYAMAWSTGSGSHAPAARRRCSRMVRRLEAADVLHHDEAAVTMLDEVVDLDDVWVLDLGQEATLGQRELVARGVTGGQGALQHHPTVGHVAVGSEVDPAETAMGEAARHLVLVSDEIASGKLRPEVERLAAARAESLHPPWLAVTLGTPDGFPAGAAPAIRLWHRGIHEQLVSRVDLGQGRQVDEPTSERANRAGRAGCGRRRSLRPGDRPSRRWCTRHACCGSRRRRQWGSRAVCAGRGGGATFRGTTARSAVAVDDLGGAPALAVGSLAGHDGA